MTHVITITPFLTGLCLTALVACGNPPNEGPSPAEIEALIAAGELAAAERRTKKYLLGNPDDPAARLLLGRIYVAAENGPAAFSAFERARRLGATGTEVLQGLAQSLMLQENYSAVLDLLDVSAETPELATPLLRLRLQARLHIPLANPGDVFDDARQLLYREPDSAAPALEDLASRDGVIAENVRHVRRAVAYWSCQQAPADAAIALEAMYVPDWADLAEGGRRILKVGPDRELKTPGAAARLARDGDIVDIAAGPYPGDVAVWNANGLWLRATGGRVVLDSGGATAEDMGIWVFHGDNAVVEGVRFTGARASHRNGSGIRFLGHNLWVRHAEFHDNEDGILAAGRTGSEVIVDYSTFTDNGAGDGYSHNLYIGAVDRLTFRFNYSAGVRIGHLLKSRARRNYILYNRLSDVDAGESSYTLDLPEGGFALVMGNEIQQGPRTVNRQIVSLGAEEALEREHRFIFAYNTFYNRSSPATFITDATDAGVALVNNVFGGAPANLDAATPTRLGNVFDASPGLRDAGQGDYGLKPSASFIDSGDPLDSLEGVSLVPQFEYVHPARARPRQPVWRADPGAHEFCGWPSYPTSRPPAYPPPQEPAP